MWYGSEPLFFDGIRVAMVNGLPSNRMVAAQSSNLYFGTGLLNERNEVRVLDMADLDGSDNIRNLAFLRRCSVRYRFRRGSLLCLIRHNVNHEGVWVLPRPLF